jgi:hypothetical protein
MEGKEWSSDRIWFPDYLRGMTWIVTRDGITVQWTQRQLKLNSSIWWREKRSETEMKVAVSLSKLCHFRSILLSSVLLFSMFLSVNCCISRWRIGVWMISCFSCCEYSWMLFPTLFSCRFLLSWSVWLHSLMPREHCFDHVYVLFVVLVLLPSVYWSTSEKQPRTSLLSHQKLAFESIDILYSILVSISSLGWRTDSLSLLLEYC